MIWERLTVKPIGVDTTGVACCNHEHQPPPPPSGRPHPPTLAQSTE